MLKNLFSYLNALLFILVPSLFYGIVNTKPNGARMDSEVSKLLKTYSDIIIMLYLAIMAVIRVLFTIMANLKNDNNDKLLQQKQ
ncbi:MAG: hypothetical protein DRG78_01515 [Epsilonproteobacteria bacterium]|nr:MAG: hypothetical protein DRG78_01515 [Campylobacterota bacterium]